MENVNAHIEYAARRGCACDRCVEHRIEWAEHMARVADEHDVYEARTGRNLFLDRLSGKVN